MPGAVLTLEVMRDAGELRDPNALDVPETAAKPAETKMARTLVQEMSARWDPAAHPDTYRAALEKLLAAKRTFALPAGAKGEAPAKVVDLMEALRKSLGRKPEHAAGAAKRRGSRRAAARRGAA
jgi:DNA end-binding protein Ku